MQASLPGLAHPGTELDVCLFEFQRSEPALTIPPTLLATADDVIE